LRSDLVPPLAPDVRRRRDLAGALRVAAYLILLKRRRISGSNDGFAMKPPPA
jgi:hypothetical protein